MITSNRGPVLLIYSAALMAGAGNGISIVAFPWLVLQRNGSAVEASVVAIAATLPLLVATLFAGTAVDYLGRRRVSMISDLLSALSVAAVPVVSSILVVAGRWIGALGDFCCPRPVLALRRWDWRVLAALMRVCLSTVWWVRTI